MVKNLLTLALCIPLGVASWSAASGLVAAWQISVPEPKAEAEAEMTESARRTADAEALLEAAIAAKSVILALDDPVAEPIAPAWVKEVLAHGKARESARRIADRERTIQDVLRLSIVKQLADLIADSSIEEDRPHAIALLDSKVKGYGKGPVQHKSTYGSCLILMDWLRLDQEHPAQTIEDLYQELESWTPEGTRQSNPLKALAAYESFLRDHADAGHELPPLSAADLVGAPDLAGEANRRVAQLRPLVGLAEVLSQEPGQSWERRVEQIRSLVEFVAAMPGPEHDRLKATAQQAYVEMCSALLPALVLNEATAQPRVAVAVHAINDRLGKMRDWNETELRELLAVCRVHRQPLDGRESIGADLIHRLERLLEVVEGQPNLFTSTY